MGTYPITKKDKVKFDLWFTSHIESLPEPSSNEAQEMGAIPSFPYKAVETFGNTTDLPTLNIHDVWGCLLTPENVSKKVETDSIRYHAWVAALQVAEQYPEFAPGEESIYVTFALRRFLVSLGLTLLDTFPGPLVTFIDPRLCEDTTAMVSEARTLVALFDEANVRRGRVLITLPATEAGIRAAHELTHTYLIRVHLSIVTCLAHACACIEAGATMLSMTVGPIMTWFEKKHGGEVNHPITPGHPGIETIQSCIDYIRQHALNTSLLAVDIRNVGIIRPRVCGYMANFYLSPLQWNELKQLNGLDAAALDQDQLHQIPQHRLVTWLPPDDESEFSPAYRRACDAEYPSRFLSRKEGSLATAFTAEDRSLMSSVVCIRLGQDQALMERIEEIVRREVRHRIDLESFNLYPTGDEHLRRMRRRSSTKHSRKRSQTHDEKPSEEPT